MQLNIIPTASAEHIGAKIAGEGKVQVVFPDKNKDGKRHFPDGEVYTRISKINELNGKTVVLCSGAPDCNSGLAELEMILSILNRSQQIHPLEVFFTYFPYGMQDNIWETGETNAAEDLIKKLVDYYNVDRIYTLDAHFAGKSWLEKYPVTNVSVVDSLVRAASNDYPKAVYLAPDAGSQRRTGLKGTEKERVNSYLTNIQSNEEFKTLVQGQVVGVVDDLLETGGTLDRFHDECMRCGAKEAIALITHGVLPAGIERIKSKYAKLYLTNSVCRNEANVDVTGAIVNAVKN